MASSLNLTAIAEIVETEEAAQALQTMGCDYGQGYYFSEPIEAESALQLLRSAQPFQPPPENSATMKIRPLEEDGSPTMRTRVDQPPDQPAEEMSPTLKIRPLQEDGSPTTRLRFNQPPDQSASETSPTTKVRPLQEEGSPTTKVRPLQQDGSPTTKVRPLQQDGSPTIRLAVDAIDERQS
jgi:hypothetical protein